METISKIEKFQEHNFHDFGFEKLSVFPNQANDPAIEIVLSNPEDDSETTLKFSQCANIIFNADFDVLKDNSGFGNTSQTEATNNIEILKKKIEGQQSLVNVEYEAGMNHPASEKLNNLENYICYQIYFFGGTLEIIAKNFSILK